MAQMLNVVGKEIDLKHRPLNQIDKNTNVKFEIETIHRLPSKTLSEQEKTAFWQNSYNQLKSQSVNIVEKHDKKYQTVQRLLQSAKKEIKIQKQQMSQIHNQNDMLIAKNLQLEKHNQLIRCELTEFESIHSETMNNLSELEQEYDYLRCEYDKQSIDYENYIHQLTSNLKTLQTQNSIIQSKLLQLQHFYANLHNDYNLQSKMLHFIWQQKLQLQYDITQHKQSFHALSNMLNEQIISAYDGVQPLEQHKLDYSLAIINDNNDASPTPYHCYQCNLSESHNVASVLIPRVNVVNAVAVVATQTKQTTPNNEDCARPGPQQDELKNIIQDNTSKLEQKIDNLEKDNKKLLQQIEKKSNCCLVM